MMHLFEPENFPSETNDIMLKSISYAMYELAKTDKEMRERFGVEEEIENVIR